tara:strand:- start:1086 stop:3656 length:2571 start_codon:yes stop_codon:yes gene_type:complete
MNKNNIEQSQFKSNVLSLMNENIKVKNYSNKKNYNCQIKETIISPQKFLLQSKDTKAHEWLTFESIVKPYYDIDMGYETEKEMIDNYPIIRDKWTKSLNEIFTGSYQNIGISSCNRYKEKVSKKNEKANLHYFVSIHFVVNSHSIELKHLEKFNKDNGFEKYLEYDKTVYSNGQNFRMIGQSKPDGNGEFCFKPYNFLNSGFKHIIQWTSIDTSWKDAKYIENIISPSKISPPVSPTTTDDEDIDNIDWLDLETTLSGIKNKYDYEYWWKVCAILGKITSFNQQGFELFNKWSSKDPDNYDEKYCELQWKAQSKNISKITMGIGTLKMWFNEENETEKKFKSKNPYKDKFLENVKPCEDGEWQGSTDTNGLITLMNKEFIFIRQTGEIICLDENQKWYLKKPIPFKELLCKYDFKNPLTNKLVKIGETWINHINRRQVLKIGFDPRNQPETDIFNIWKGMRISTENASTFEVSECQPLLNHIKNRWCNDIDDDFEYVLNWLAHLIQKPWVKMGVVICLRSTKEGAGKGIVMNLLRKIIGDNHYFQCNNLEQLTGSFNGIGEGKILTNLDEAFWGKDKKKEGMLKNLITEETKLVNKKNKESYIIDDYSNYIVSTNNDCFIPAVEGGRRFFAIELSNELSGIQTPKKKLIIDELLNVPAESFARFLYERDISSFNPRQFNKTALLQEQIQHNWCSVRKWWFEILNSGGFTGNLIDNGYCQIGDIPVSQKKISNDNPEPLFVWGVNKTKFKYGNDKRKVKDEDGRAVILDSKTFYEKDFIYSNYEENCNGYKLDKSHFWINYKKHCVDKLMVEAQLKDDDCIKKRYIIINDIDAYRNKFNELQEYEYEYSVEDFSEWE